MSIPGGVNPLLLRSAAAAGGYTISRSLRFSSIDSAYLSRTPALAGNRRTFTYAAWIKRAGLGTEQFLFICRTPTTTEFCRFVFTSSDKLTIWNRNSSSSTVLELITTQVFRDPGAWLHVVLSVDTTAATAANRCRLFINGTQVTAFSTATYPSQNADLDCNTTATHFIGCESPSNVNYNGYLADVFFIDGQALDPSSFTETSATTRQLIPKAYTGSFGTNGFWLKFSDNSAATATTLGKDYSGNGNNWTPNNLSVTAGAGNDSLTDTPTSFGTDTGAGGEVRGNYCTWNPLFTNSAFTISNGNLDLATSSVSDRVCASTFGLSSGKWYWEITFNSGAGVGIGVCTSAVNLASYLGGTSASRSYDWDGKKYPGAASYGASYTTGDVIGVAVDIDAGTLVYYKNGVSQGTAFSDLAGSTWFPAIGDQSSSGNVAISANFGQRPFAYTAPSGFKALCDTNLPAPVVAKPSTVMDVKLYTGNGSTQTISGLGFSPDLVWLKARSAATAHLLFDQIRGATYYLSSNATDAESNSPSNTLTAFTSDGFTLGSNSSANGSSVSLAAWTWDAGSSTVTNTQGSITSSCRANPSAGFSVCTYTGSSSNFTFGHGLNVEPRLILIKNRSASANWFVITKATGSWQYGFLNATDPLLTAAQSANSTTVNLVNAAYNWFNANGDNFVAYVFSPVAGYSSAFSFTGNGSSDGPMVWLGFKPRFLFIKRTDSASHWPLYDTARNPYNVTNSNVWASTSDGEITDAAYSIDILSNGFKLRTSDAARNASGGTYIGFAWAENPFQYARAR